MSRDWKGYSELIGLAAVVVSLVFVGMELRQSQRVAFAQMQATGFSNMIEVRANIMDHADIWQRGNSDAELTPTEAVIYQQMVLLENERIFHAIQQFEALGLEEYVPLDSAALAGFLYENPRARQVWQAHEARLEKYRGMVSPGSQFTSEWVQKIESAIAAIEQGLGQGD